MDMPFLFVPIARAQIREAYVTFTRQLDRHLVRFRGGIFVLTNDNYVADNIQPTHMKPPLNILKIVNVFLVAMARNYTNAPQRSRFHSTSSGSLVKHQTHTWYFEVCTFRVISPHAASTFTSHIQLCACLHWVYACQV